MTKLKGCQPPRLAFIHWIIALISAMIVSLGLPQAAQAQNYTCSADTCDKCGQCIGKQAGMCRSRFCTAAPAVTTAAPVVTSAPVTTSEPPPVKTATPVAGDKCADGKKNGMETDTDCGGKNACPRCDNGKQCKIGTDCESGLCDQGLCKAPKAPPSEPKCPEHSTKAADGKCVCDTGFEPGADNTCVPTPTCTDKVQNGDETGIDCGGSCKKGCCDDAVNNATFLWKVACGILGLLLLILLILISRKKKDDKGGQPGGGAKAPTPGSPEPTDQGGDRKIPPKGSPDHPVGVVKGSASVEADQVSPTDEHGQTRAATMTAAEAAAAARDTEEDHTSPVMAAARPITPAEKTAWALQKGRQERSHRGGDPTRTQGIDKSPLPEEASEEARQWYERDREKSGASPLPNEGGGDHMFPPSPPEPPTRGNTAVGLGIPGSTGSPKAGPGIAPRKARVS